MNPLELYTPKLEELDFYQKVLQDPDTMSYNAACFPPDGCIDFPRDKWSAWYEKWLGDNPETFFSYLRRTCDGAFVGYVHYRYDNKENWWDIGIIIHAPFRGQGYGKEGLKLLIDKAFMDRDVHLLHNTFEKSREEALHLHRSFRFSEVASDDGLVELFLKREDYLEEST